jgi:large subunit ribosomal protein L15
MPIYRRLPRRGFNPLNKVQYQVVNTGRLQRLIDAGRLDASADITTEVMVAAGLARSNGAPIRLLADGELTAAIRISVHSGSRQAIAVVEKAGGTVTVAGA